MGNSQLRKERAPLCEQESVVRAANRQEGLSAGIKTHVDVCPACTETLEIAQSLYQLTVDRGAKPLPSAASVWRRSSLRMQREKTRQAIMPIIWMKRLSSIVWAVASIILLVRDHSRIAVESPILKAGLISLGGFILVISAILWSWARSEPSKHAFLGNRPRA